jgi:hypothetical protein
LMLSCSSSDTPPPVAKLMGVLNLPRHTSLFL